MKLSKRQLKAIVKECLIEILTEGLGSNVGQLGESSKVSRNQRNLKQRLKPKDDSNLKNALPTEALKKAVIETSKGNSVMADILADTAVTTLPNLLAGDKPNYQPPPAKSSMTGVEPSELFEGASDRWANLAFNSPKTSSLMSAPPPPPQKKLSNAELDAQVK